jgi:hypothetical protein
MVSALSRRFPRKKTTPTTTVEMPLNGKEEDLAIENVEGFVEEAPNAV